MTKPGSAVTWSAPPSYIQKTGEVVAEVPAGVLVDAIIDQVHTSPFRRAPKFRGAKRARHTRVLVRVEDRPHHPVYYAVAPERLKPVRKS